MSATKWHSPRALECADDDETFDAVLSALDSASPAWRAGLTPAQRAALLRRRSRRPSGP